MYSALEAVAGAEVEVTGDTAMDGAGGTSDGVPAFAADNGVGSDPEVGAAASDAAST